MVEPDIRIAPADELPAFAASAIAAAISDAVAARGRCRVGLAGGGTPAPIYRALAALPDVPWGGVEVFWGDERAVPPRDPGSNYAMAREALLDRIDIPSSSVHRIRGELGADGAAVAYASTLGDQPIDVLLLGMGGDGHTASLFPGDQPIGDGRVVAATSPVPPHARISLSEDALNEAGVVMLLVAGDGKASRLAEVLDQIRSGEPALPAARVQPTSGRLVWLIDTGAAGQLENKEPQ